MSPSRCIRTVASSGARPGALGLSGAVGASAAAVTTTGYGLPPERAKGRILTGDNATVVKELVRLLREEAKVI